MIMTGMSKCIMLVASYSLEVAIKALTTAKGRAMMEIPVRSKARAVRLSAKMSWAAAINSLSLMLLPSTIETSGSFRFGDFIRAQPPVGCIEYSVSAIQRQPCQNSIVCCRTEKASL